MSKDVVRTAGSRKSTRGMVHKRINSSICKSKKTQDTKHAHHWRNIKRENLLCHCLISEICLTLVTPWTVACQTLLYMRFPRLECWSGCHFLLQGIFLILGSNSCLLHWQTDSLLLDHLGSPENLISMLLNIMWPLKSARHSYSSQSEMLMLKEKSKI